MSGANFPGLPTNGADPRSVATVVNRMNGGKINAVIPGVTLAVNSDTTTLEDPRLAVGSFLGFMPTTANAQAEGTPYVTDQGNGTATLNHANNAESDRTYTVLVIG